MMQPQPGSLPVADEAVHALLDPAQPTTDPFLQVLQLAMTGFGYNFYDAKNVARSNDLLIRQKLSADLHDAARALETLERAYRDRYIGTPTREHPYPEPDKSRRAKAIHGLASELDSLGSAFLVAESPGRDAIWSRFRDEGQMLQKLVGFDVALVSDTRTITDGVAELTPAAADIDGALDPIEAVAHRIRASLNARRNLLTA
jgi:hypothetical protein